MVERISPDELRTLFLFEGLDEAQLGWLSSAGHALDVEPGVVFAEGDPGRYCFVLLAGGIAMSKRFGRQDVELNRSNRRGVYVGAFHALYGDPEGGYTATLRATEPSRFFVLDARTLFEMIRTWLPMAVHLIQGVVAGMRRTNSQLGQRERLMALGSLTAGLTHELNNPASAAVEAVTALRRRQEGGDENLELLLDGSLDPAALRAVFALQRQAVAAVSGAPALTPMARSDAQDTLTDWLEQHEVDAAWDIAAVLTDAGLDTAWTELVLDAVGPKLYGPALRWLASAVEREVLLHDITDSAGRIFTLVDAAKQYSQLDRAPDQLADLATLLDSTLTVRASRLAGLTVVRDYDPSLPPVPVFAAELNQVWTNLIDNAVDAMAGSGTLTVRTARERECALVEVVDTGPGIPPEIRSRVFDPFFTTKPVGSGTGLGLDLAWRVVMERHAGDMEVVSEPGDTRFRVWLPLRSPATA